MSVPGVKINQVISYTGAANFALFVNVTPGAVGIRETFLFFSEKLHHITNAAIIGSNVLDRSVYIIFLAIMFLVLLVVRGKSAFPLKGNPAVGYVIDSSEPEPRSPSFRYIRQNTAKPRRSKRYSIPL